MPCCCISISQADVGIVETCGKFSTTLQPGCHCLLPYSSVVNILSSRLTEMNCTVESKTKDNVFVELKLTIQYQILPEKAQSVHYRIRSPNEMIQPYVLNSIRAKVPLYLLDALYVERSNISQQLKEEVDEVMEGYGIDIMSALVVDIQPRYGVSEAIDQVQKVQRLRVAAVDAAETEKLTRVRAAEASCTSRRLAGEGLAQQRKALVAGLLSTVKEMKSDVPSLSTQDAATMLIMNQYYDTLRAIASRSGRRVMVWETSGGLERVASQLNRGIEGII